MALIVIAAVGIVVGIFIWKKKKVAPVPATVQAADKKPASPVMLQQPDGRETITPSEMSTHMQSRTNSHGKLKQVLGTEFTMTDEAKLKSVEKTETSGAGDDTGLNTAEVGESDAEASPRKLPPITDVYVPPKSPAADTHLQEPLPPIHNQ